MTDNFKEKWFLILIFNHINILIFLGSQWCPHQLHVRHVNASPPGDNSKKLKEITYDGQKRAPFEKAILWSYAILPVNHRFLVLIRFAGIPG